MFRSMILQDFSRTQHSNEKTIQAGNVILWAVSIQKSKEIDFVLKDSLVSTQTDLGL